VNPEPVEKVFSFTATGWTAVGSIVGAISIAVLSVFNWRYLRAALRAAVAAEKQATAAQNTLVLVKEQLALTERPFIAIHSDYCEEIDAYLVYAHNQGNGPALDVEASLIFQEEDERQSSYTIGCLAEDARFQFLIGDTSMNLVRAVLWYKSISGQKWTTNVLLPHGHPIVTNAIEGYQFRDGDYVRVKDFSNT
jgi:hypothetical protein